MDDGTEMKMASYPLLAKLEGQPYVYMIHSSYMLATFEPNKETKLHMHLD